MQGPRKYNNNIGTLLAKNELFELKQIWTKIPNIPKTHLEMEFSNQNLIKVRE